MSVSRYQGHAHRDDVRLADCPTCLVAAGVACRRANGKPRVQNHAAREEARLGRR